MITKVNAAKKVTAAGIPMVIAGGAKPDIKIDSGAAAALLKKGKSLLSGGIIGVEGEFSVGAPVEFKTDNKTLGTGLVNYSSADIRKIMGLRSSKIEERLGYKSYDEVIHRDNLAITYYD
jgi:glutamate 5-kinase